MLTLKELQKKIKRLKEISEEKKADLPEGNEFSENSEWEEHWQEKYKTDVSRRKAGGEIV